MFLPLHDRNPVRHVTFPFVTYGIIALNIVVFLIQLTHAAGFDFELFALTYAAVPSGAFGSEVPDRIPGLPDEVTLVTYAFLHADWLHLGSNMLFLWVFGDNVEDALGHLRYAVFYLLCAIASALLFFAFAGNQNWLIGASGAVAGVLGAYLVLFPFARVYVLFRLVIPIPLPIPALWMLGVWGLMQLWYAVTGDTSGVAWWAHVGGLITGAVLAIPLRRAGVPLFGGR